MSLGFAALVLTTLSTPHGMVRLELPGGGVRELVPARIELHGPPPALDDLELWLSPLGAPGATLPRERLVLQRRAPELAWVDYTFRKAGHYAIGVQTAGRRAEARIEVRPQEWMTFPVQFGAFVLGVILLVAGLFGLAHWIRRRALQRPDEPGAPLAR